MRKRILGIAALAGAVAVAFGMPTAGTTAPREFSGKPCMDIFVASPGYTSETGAAGETGTFAAVLTTAAPSCPGAVYTVTVTYTDRGTGGTVTETFTFIGNGTTDEYPISLTIENAPAEICVNATSRPNSKSNAAADRAPDSGCRIIPLTTSGGASGFG